MDRIDAMKVFAATLDQGSLSGAARHIGRSPASVSRAIAFLEKHLGIDSWCFPPAEGSSTHGRFSFRRGWR